MRYAPVLLLLFSLLLVSCGAPLPTLPPRGTLPPRVATSVQAPTQPPPPLNLTNPLPAAPGGRMITASLGPVVLETFHPVTITPLEDSTNFYVYARNMGDKSVTVQGPRAFDVPVTQLTAALPRPKHFFELNPFATVIPSGKTAVFEFMLAGISDGEEIQMVLSFTLVETKEKANLTLKVTSSNPGAPGVLPFPSNTAAIQGRVTARDGTPLANVEVTAYTFNNRYDWRSQTDSAGYYSIVLPSTGDLKAALGSRPLPYHSLGFVLIAAREGYTVGYRDRIELARGKIATIDLTLEPVALANYALADELATDGLHGYWWLFPNRAFDRVAAVQARHPPETRAPGHIVMTDLSAKELWRLPTTAECWGFDVSVSGDIAAGCHDGAIYLADTNGKLRWQAKSSQMNRMVKFSPEGSLLLTGPFGGKDIALLDVASGRSIWEYGKEGDWVRNAVWSVDGKRFLTGHSGGRVLMFTRNGELLWQASIGEFPMVLEMDSGYNTYMAGKSREVFSFDAVGKLHWRWHLGTVVSDGANSMSADGSVIVFGTISGWIFVFNRNGDLLWQRRLPGNLQGHNAVDVTPDGDFILVGSAGERRQDGYLSLYDRSGALLWQNQITDRRDSGQAKYPYEYDHNHRGIITVTISDDARVLVAGYGDSTIRVFSLKETPK